MAGSQTVSSQWLSFMGGWQMKMKGREERRRKREGQREGQKEGRVTSVPPNPPTCGFAKEAGQIQTFI